MTFKNGLVCILLGLTTWSCKENKDLPIHLNLDQDWSFKQVNDSIWMSATIPGNVHSDLLDHKLIKDPFIGDNAVHLDWVSESGWEYQSNFSVEDITFQKKHITLNFEGLDTYASVFLNDSLILKTDNAFREFEVDVKSIIKSENELRIVFENTTTHEYAAKGNLSYQLPEGSRIFTRKAQFQYGWDWGPKLNTSGIWRPIGLNAWNDLKIRDVYVDQIELNDSVAEFILDIKVHAEDKSNLSYNIYVNDKLNTTYSDQNKSKITFQIKNPKRWWPHNIGEPYLYNFKIVIRDNKTILDTFQLKKGLRTIELVTEKDSIGESFYFKVNDVPIYMKGSNYIPQNSMQNHVTDSHYENLLTDVVDANMNMLRVWGGGIYENDIFYDLCDEKGILVWQDFMFACAMYPGDADFLENVKQEAIENVTRLRNHASIALWCGNNENSEGWNRWGWQVNRSEEEKEEIWNNYLNVFDSILPKVVAQYSNTDYWQSSPKYGRGNPKYKFEGDAHDWWIWHDAYPFEHLEHNVPRFMSEFGFQSFPGYETIQYINQKDSLDISSEAFKTHQKQLRGFQLIDEYMHRDFPVPDTAEDYIYMSQVLQAYGITKGIEAHRRAKPYNMGTLYWQLNDCWPAISWSSIDFSGQWKALHYKIKKSFENILVSSSVVDDSLITYVVNDRLKNMAGTLSLKLIDFSGQELWKSNTLIEVDANSSKIYSVINLKGIDKTNAVLVATVNNHSFNYYLSKPKELKLKPAVIQQSIQKTETGFRIELSSTSLQKDVFLFTDSHGHFSDNYFDLLPNETITIDFKSEATDLELKLKSLNMFID
ncbi:beta-mannosidase [Flavobacteriales bacterium 34_180_T64]|nr:beta-mannosidase [Flavobacteriales bacterium 34_180_T64]